MAMTTTTTTTTTTTDAHDDLQDRGLAFDLHTLMARRRVLRLFGTAGATGLAILAGCAGDEAASPSTQTGSSPAASATAETAAGSPSTPSAGTGATCSPIPTETAGPFPADGSNGPNLLAESGVVRQDIRSSFGSSTTTAAGVPLNVSLAVTDTANGCAPYAGAAVYLWHCDQEGRYSMYSEGATGENYLRGVQEAGADGVVTFTSVFPACYAGRWPHIHFEVYPSLDDATGGGQPASTSQLALPEDVCAAVFATAGYEQSVENVAQTSLSRDNVFADDGGEQQLATVSGDVTAGYTASLSVPV